MYYGPLQGKTLFLTQTEWDLILILTSHIKVRKVSSFVFRVYTCCTNRERKGFEFFFCALNVHRRRLSILFVDFPRWSCVVFLDCFFHFNIAVFSYPVMIATHVNLFSAVFSVLRVYLFVFDHNFAILPLSVNCKFDVFIFICFFDFLPWISTLHVLRPFVTFQFSSSLQSGDARG